MSSYTHLNDMPRCPQSPHEVNSLALDSGLSLRITTRDIYVGGCPRTVTRVTLMGSTCSDTEYDRLRELRTQLGGEFLRRPSDPLVRVTGEGVSKEDHATFAVMHGAYGPRRP